MQPREHWSTRLSFVMAAVGSAVGLGNLWRFPATCAANGGGAFLLPYFLALASVGIPLLILEFSLGHRMQHAAPAAIERIRPTFSWVGWWAVLMGFIIVSFYTVVMAWCLEYVVYSFWPSALEAWQTDASGFFNRKVLWAAEGLEGRPGGIVWPLVGCLAICWGIIFLLIFKGIKQVGKVVLLTVPLPIVLVVVLFVRGITLPNALEGLQAYLQPDFELLKEPSVWLAAYGQIFFTLSLGFGVMVAYASYLDRETDITNNAFLTGLINCGFSFFTGFAVFSVLGFLATIPGNEDALEQAGGGLAFIAYPTALARLPGAHVFSVLFFVTLLTLGIDSAFSIVEAITASLMEKFNLSRYLALGIVCLAGFLGGLVFCTQNGSTYLDVTNKFIEFGMVTGALSLCIVVGWFYGARKMRNHINRVSEIRIGRWWDALIMYVAPVVLGAVLVSNIYEQLTMERDDYMEPVVLFLGWLPLIGTLVLATVLMALKRTDQPATTFSMIKVLLWLAIIIAGVYFYPKHPEIVMAGFGCLFLYGGLGYCILRIRRARRRNRREAAAPADVGRGPA